MVIIFNTINKLIKINKEHKRLIECRVSEIGIHRTQHRILMYLAQNGEIPSQKKIAEHFELTPAAITGALQKLEADGYIERKLGTDNRFNEIKITEKGLEAVEKTKAMFSAVDSLLFKDFTKSEIDDFSAYLEKILDNLKGVNQ